MLTRFELDAALARCEEIVQRRPTHLGQAAAELKEPRRRSLFLASYASMRIADDLVDEDFLSLPSADRITLRPGTEESLARWLAQSELAATGSFVPREDSLEPDLFLALSDQMSATELDAGPWRKLARSLGRDLAERPIEDWEDFLEYCEGACIAPASVFVYIVGAVFEADGSSHFPAGADPRDLARELAIYSYLVHIRRDLLEDAKRSGQLVLLPRAWMRESGCSEQEALAALATGRTDALRPALERLAEETRRFRGRAADSLQKAERELGAEAARSLRGILRMYEAAERRD